MAGQQGRQPTRQLYAQIREDIYLAAKARAAEMRVPLRELLENALVRALNGDESHGPKNQRSVWDDEYLSMQERQPFGSPVELTREEAVAIVREALAANGHDDSSARGG